MTPVMRCLAAAAVLSCCAACSTPVAGNSSVGPAPGSRSIVLSSTATRTSAVSVVTIPASLIPYSQLTAAPTSIPSSPATTVAAPTSHPTPTPTSAPTPRPTPKPAPTTPTTAPPPTPPPTSVRLTTSTSTTTSRLTTTAPAALTCPPPHLLPAPDSIRFTKVECYDGATWLVASGVYADGGAVDGVEIVHQTGPGRFAVLGSGSDFSDSQDSFRAAGMPADLIGYLVNGQPADHQTRTES